MSLQILKRICLIAVLCAGVAMAAPAIAQTPADSEAADADPAAQAADAAASEGAVQNGSLEDDTAASAEGSASEAAEGSSAEDPSPMADAPTDAPTDAPVEASDDGIAADPAPAPAAVAAEKPDVLVHTNQDMVEEVTWVSDLDVSDELAVLELVLNSLPDTVTVYPTENYFYFSFYDNAIKYAGNLRLDVSERDEGFVNFIYFEEFNGWHTELTEFGRKLGPDDGVDVSKVDDLTYTITFRDRTVTFNLNDLSGVTPPAQSVGDDETVIGPVFDESGMRFFLVFNKSSKTFIYFLDETVPFADRLRPVEGTERMYLGQRTGFVFYDDIDLNRLILVAVFAENTGVNNYLDGPFDQLPDNFLEGNVLIDSILAVDPHLEGQLDRFGNTPDGQSRYLIAPYMQFDEVEETVFIEDCANVSEGAEYYQCFSFAF
ncbi:MAG: hypothetical protein AAGB11_12805 [Pseudomonadota bacterium]